MSLRLGPQRWVVGVRRGHVMGGWTGRLSRHYWITLDCGHVAQRSLWRPAKRIRCRDCYGGPRG